MSRRRKAWLVGGDGVRKARGKRVPGFHVRWSEFVGSRCIHRARCFTTARAARVWVRNYNARLDLNLIGEVVPIPLNDANREYIRTLTTHTQRTVSQTATTLGVFARNYGDTLVRDVLPTDIDAWLAERLVICASSTVAGDRACLHAFWAWATEVGYAPMNIVDKTRVRPPRLARRRPMVTEQQLATLVEALDTEDRKLAVLLALTSGLDRGVIRTLTADDINWQDGYVHLVTRPKLRRFGKPLVVPIHPDLLPHLHARRGHRPPPQPLLRGLWREAKARDWWHRAAVAADCPQLVFRDLRALAAMRLQRLGGATLSDAQHILGHLSAATTAKFYYAPMPSVSQALQRVPLPATPGTVVEISTTPAGDAPPSTSELPVSPPVPDHPASAG